MSAKNKFTSYLNVNITSFYFFHFGKDVRTMFLLQQFYILIIKQYNAKQFMYLC